MSTKELPVREPVSPYVRDAILRETAKKEDQFSSTFDTFQPSLSALRDACPDKPLVNTRPVFKIDEDDEEMAMLRSTLDFGKRGGDPVDKYDFPPTTSMEIGWTARNLDANQSIFNHKRQKTDITMLPSKWDPNANKMAAKV